MYLCRFAGSLGRNFRGSLHYDGGLTSFIPSIQGCLTQKVTFCLAKPLCNAYNAPQVVSALHLSIHACTHKALLREVTVAVWVPGDLLPSRTPEQGCEHCHQPSRAV